MNRTLLLCGGVLSLASLIIGIAIAIGSLQWLESMADKPAEPPGQIAAIIPMAGTLVGGLMAIMGLLGLWVVQHLWRRKTNVTVTGSGNEPS